MNINQLESYKLSDAVKFHDKLNSKIFVNNKPRPEVKKQLLLIAKDFITELGINDLDIIDVTISGSNAAYTYTKHSDLDLHIIVDMSKLPNDEIYHELFNSKKTLYNDSHNIKIHGIPVELYVQDNLEPVISLGEYSLLKNKWLKFPTRQKINVNQTLTSKKYNKLLELIRLALKSKNIEKIQELLKTIRRYRQAGLDVGGEFSPENLAYKMLRSQGYITKLYDLRDKLHGQSLSIESVNESNHILYEGMSSILYHYTRTYNAKKILSSGVFQLSSTLGSVEEQYAPRGYPYFLSTTRSRRGGYHDTIGNDAVLFVLDGTWYSRHYKAMPVDYWLNRNPEQLHHRSHEAEDRIFSKESSMSIKGVREIHIYVSPDSEEKTKAWARQDLILAKQRGIQTYFYTDENAWRNQDKRKLGDVSILKGQEYSREYVSRHKGYLLPWVELIKAQDKNQLSKKADRIRYSLHYAYDKKEAASGLANDLSNARKPDTGPDRENAVNIIKYMQANKLTTVSDLVNNLSNKWKSLSITNESKVLDKPTPTINDLVKKHNVSKEHIMDQLLKGIQVELEHTSDDNKAKEIALDHLGEDPDYYTKLASLDLEEDSGWSMYPSLYSAEKTLPVTPYGTKEREFRGSISENLEEASGYIPSESEKNDPRFKTALTVDIKPDTMKKNAKKLGFKISRSGLPPLLR